jgi:DNA-binding HxlR family transcriptional regulator
LLCPISRACEILEPRWTIQILTEIWAGSTRFNDIRRAVGGISPGVLSRRLSEMEASGLIERVVDRAKGTVDYVRTEKGAALEPALNALAAWAQQNIEAEVALADTAISPLMWKLRTVIRVDQLPSSRSVIRFHFKDGEGQFDTYWLIAERGCLPEICAYDPGLDIDLYIETTVVALGGIIMGRTTVERESDRGSLFMSGDARLARTIGQWLPVSRHAHTANICQLAGR